MIIKIKPSIKFQLLNTIPGFKNQQAVLCNRADKPTAAAGNQKHRQTVHTSFSFLFLH